MSERQPDGVSWRVFHEQLKRLGHRRLVLVEGDPQWCRGWVTRQLASLEASCRLWVGQSADAERAGLPGIAARQYKRWLGQELDVLVWDGWQGNPPDGFAALAGTLKAGGLLFWLMPPLAQWRQFEDPDYPRTGLEQASGHPFAARQAQILAQAPGVLRVNAESSGELPVLPAPVPGEAFAVGTTTEQKALVEALVRFGLGRRRRPLVVTADRGRGKSAALGMAAAQLLLQGRQQVLVTAPSVDNVQTLFRHAASELEW